MKKRSEIPKKLMVRAESLYKQNPVIDSTTGKFTAVSLIPYNHATGFRRDAGRPALIGYCVESPREVLEAAFGDYHVTQYNGYELFSGEDFKSTTPMLGLGIRPIEPLKVYGIEYNGRIEDLLQLDELIKAKRSEPISFQDIDRILAHLSKKLYYRNPCRDQCEHDTQEIIDIVKRFR